MANPTHLGAAATMAGAALLSSDAWAYWFCMGAAGGFLLLWVLVSLFVRWIRKTWELGLDVMSESASFIVGLMLLAAGLAKTGSGAWDSAAKAVFLASIPLWFVVRIMYGWRGEARQQR